MNTCIVGGGLLGITLGYLLTRQGTQVQVFEASPALGGMAGTLTLDDGVRVDRFYHALLSSDTHLHQLCMELGLKDRLRFRETKMGFFHQGHIYSMNSIGEFLRFPPLNWIDRFRLGLTILYAQTVHDWQRLEGVPVEHWLRRLSGQRTVDNIWRPMLRAKFDGSFEDTPATYIWSRLVRVKSTRGGASQRESAGHLIGGYMALIDAMAAEIERHGGAVHLNAPVDEIVIEHGTARGVQVGHEQHPADRVVVTLQTPLFRKLIPEADAVYQRQLDAVAYLGIVCPLLVMDRPLTEFWTLNITDERIPFTGIIETTAYIDPQHVGGHHLVYLPKYTAPGSPWQALSDHEIAETWLQHLETMFPHFDRRWIRYLLVQREQYVEPLHGLNGWWQIPPIQTPIEQLFLATTAQIYPALTNAESVTRHARSVAAAILERETFGSLPAPVRGIERHRRTIHEPL